MSYLTPEMTRNALRQMQRYHDAQIETHKAFGIDMLANRGRRNIIMSQAQEEFFAQELGKVFEGVTCDGRTGQADIFIGETGQELECKITSPLATGAINFQTDHDTLVKKGELDYLYVIASEEFDKFCVLHFRGLSVSDFHPPHAAGRGRAAMIKHFGMMKCTVLHGMVVNGTERKVEEVREQLKQLPDQLDAEIEAAKEKRKFLEFKLDMDAKGIAPLTSRRRYAIRKQSERARKRPDLLRKQFTEREQRVRSELTAWEGKPGRFTFVLEALP